MTPRNDSTKQTIAIIRLIGFVFTSGVAQMTLTSLALAASLQSKSVVANNNQGIKFMITVPVRLLSLDSQVRFGKMECIIMPTPTSGSNDGLGVGKSIFSINHSDGSFIGNVTATVIPYKGVPDSKLAPELYFDCGLSLSQDGNTWLEPNDSNPPNMFTVKSGTTMRQRSVGTIPASK